MSGTQVSPFAPANALFDLGQVYQSYDRHQNALLQQQETQQGIDARGMEYMARAAAGLLDPQAYPDEASRAAAYPGVIAELQRYGLAPNAPSEYPGEAALRRVQAMGTPSADQFKLGANARTNESLLGRTGTPQPGAPGTGAPATTVAAPSGDIEPEAVTRANAVRDGLMKRGMDPETATAFAANALHESSAKPDTGAGDGGRSHGLFQWNADRLAAYQAKFGHAPDNAPLDEQLDFVMHELGGTESLARGRIASAQGVAGKAAQVSEAYLRPKDTVAEMQRRSATALRLAQQGLSAPASGQPTSDTAWLDNQARMYPNLAGPNAPAQPPAGGPGTPGRVQVASVTPTGPGGAPTATDATPAPLTPQNTLATPGVGPQPPPAATQPPAPTQAASPAIPRPQPPAPMVRDNLTAGDIAELGQLTRSLTPAQFEAAKYQRQQANVARQEKYQGDVRQWENDQAARADKAATERRAEVAASDAAAKAERERQAAADPIQGTGDKPNADRTLFKYADQILDGSAPKEIRRLYAQAAQYYLKPHMEWVADPNDPTKSIMVPVAGQLPEGFPHPSYEPGKQPTPPPTATKGDFKQLPESERKVLVDTATKLDQLNEQRTGFKPEYGGFGSAAIGDLANTVARNNPIASKADTARAEWWQNYQRMKLAVRQGVSGQSLTASELGEFDKADINPGMSAETIKANLAHQDQILRTAHERRVGSLAADRYNPDAIRAASGLDPAAVKPRPVDAGPTTKPAEAPPWPGYKVIIP